MYLHNLTFDLLDLEKFKYEVRLSLDKETLASDEEIENALADNYFEANRVMASRFLESNHDLLSGFLERQEVNQETNMETMMFFGRGLWQKVREFFCRVLKATSSDDVIIDEILKYLLSILPGGIIFQNVASKIVKYFLNWGYGHLCPGV